MYEMQTIVIDNPGRLFVTWLHYANKCEQIKILLGVETLEDPRNIVLDGSLNSPTTSMWPSPNYFVDL